jgi:AraC family transcriptional regulator
MSQLRPLLESEQFRVLDSRCRHPRGGPADERGGHLGHLVLLRRGCFSYHTGVRRYVADACTALLHHPRVDFRIGHPGTEGDDATVIMLGPALFDELWGGRGPDRPELALSPQTQLLHARTHAALLAGAGDRLACEERVLALLEAAAAGPNRTLPPTRGTPGARRRAVARARALLADQLRVNVSLAAVAQEAGCSPFHLMRLFHAETGLSLRAWRRQLRVLTALQHLAQGEQDLGRLALELGFAHHSHLTQSVRSVLGSTPSRLRLELQRSGRS